MKNPIILIVGARPNFMKATPLARELSERGIPMHLIHTGQHYDEEMAEQFFNEFDIRPDTTFSLTSKSSVSQLAEIMTKLEKEFESLNPRAVIVFGDVTSTLAGAIVARKMGIKLAHVEAGLRSYNNLMPEEAHRKLTDHISSLLFAPSEEDKERLSGENINDGVHVVGNIMMDLLSATSEDVPTRDEEYYFATLHRAENVDNKERFIGLIEALRHISQDSRIYLILHHRTEKKAREYGLYEKLEEVFTLLPPLSYRESVGYQKSAKLILTDSGGIQEEASFLGVPCLTLRTETERPITVTEGTNVVAGVESKGIISAYKKIQPLVKKEVSIPLWDGKTAKRIVDILVDNV